MSDDPNVKKIVLTGAALQSGGGATEKKTRKNRKQVSMRGGGGNEGTPAPVNATRIPDTSVANTKVIQAATTIASAPAPLPSTASTSQQGGATKHVKVVLAPKKKKTAKVILASPKKKALQAITNAVVSAGHKTRKIAKKIRMSMSSLSNRMTRAQKIRKESKDLSMDKIKEALKNAHLIKETTKAPDAILRQMYTDYLLLKNRAL